MNTPPGTETGGPTYSGYGPPRQPPHPPRRSPWRFVRREEGKWLAGVTTGLADAFGVEVTVVRVIWAIVTIFSGGLGIAAYAICWFAFPSDEHAAPFTQMHRLRHRGAGYVLGVVLLAIGAIVVLGQIASLRPMHHIGGVVWAVFLIGGGLAILFLRNHDGDEDTDEPAPMPAPIPMPAPAETPAAAPYAATFASETVDPPAVDAPDGDVAVDDLVDPTDATTGDGFAPPADPSPPLPPLPPTSSAWTQTAEWPTARPRRPRRPRRRAFLTPITLSVLMIGAGGAALLNSSGAVNFTLAGVLAAGLILVGIVMIVSTWFGRAHGLIPIGVILLLAAIPATAIDVPISGGIGERQHYPTTRTELQRNYKLGIGHLLLQLGGAPLKNRITSIDAQLGIGELEVEVPSNVRVDVRSHVGAGHTELFGSDDGGWPHDDHAVAGANQKGVLHLDLRVGAGSLIVRRRGPNGQLLENPYVYNG